MFRFINELRKENQTRWGFVFILKYFLRLWFATAKYINCFFFSADIGR